MKLEHPTDAWKQEKIRVWPTRGDDGTTRWLDIAGYHAATSEAGVKSIVADKWDVGSLDFVLDTRHRRIAVVPYL